MQSQRRGWDPRSETKKTKLKEERSTHLLHLLVVKVLGRSDGCQVVCLGGGLVVRGGGKGLDNNATLEWKWTPLPGGCKRWKGANRSSRCCCWGKGVHLKASLQIGTPTWWTICKLKRYNGGDKGQGCAVTAGQVVVLSQTWGEIQWGNPNSLKQDCVGWECCASQCHVMVHGECTTS